MFEKIKYTGDDPYVYGLNDQEFLPDTSETVRKDLLSNSLRVTEEMFPEIYQMINEVLYKLEIDSNVETFISSDPNPQALCIAQLNSVDFIIIITSSLLEILSPSELSFVIGHEIGHYVFKHYKYPRPSNNESQIERFNKLQLSRAAEISADRIGLLATISEEGKSRIEVAVSSMIKIVSGVSDKYFKLNISSYLKQGRDLIQISGNSEAIHSTHPVFPDRVPALMQFEISEPYYQFTKSDKISSINKEKLDSSIDKKMKSHSGNALEEHIKDLAKGFTIWATILLINIDGTFSSKEVAAMRHMFDDETANEVEKFYENADANELENYIHDMINQEIKKIEGLPIKDRQDILYNIERISSVCDGEENEIVRQLSFIAKLLDLNSKVQIRSMDFNK
tara:strand:- start:284 stop:1468 length:1185 start_codon:yes stop_codon:yes gene_type:complete